MTINGSGLYGLTTEKQMIGTSLPASGIESETAVKVMLMLDAYTPNYDTHDFRNDIEANEATGTGYSAGGSVITTTEVTLSSGILTYDAADVAWSSSTIANAMAAVGYFARGGASSADEVIWLSDFISAASSSSGTLTVQWSASGIYTLDYVP